MENRRQFFFEFAASKGFDPMIAENWTNVTKVHIIDFNVRNLYLFGLLILAYLLSIHRELV